MGNMTIYNAVRAVPGEAKKPIKGGRLKGKTDINPMWRIKALTEQFGPCGFGWKYEIIRRESMPSPTGEIAVFVDINLYIKVDGEWSAPIPGTGGNSFVEKESNGLHMSDECFKMALTDALSVACKAIGVAADVYWETDRSKYDKPNVPTAKADSKEGRAAPLACPACGKEVKGIKKDGTEYDPAQVLERCGGLCLSCYKARKESEQHA